ncbi:hypothetical protein SAMN04487950_1886 [Halogranum rubrum]|uniref:DUF8048 domain-containing protein n=1 Tax=Halogranum rubrum TaxID=553466 RepID=A0A1I4E6G5_9EURY|nr:hypothetical protein [Halogranum rubrum]SFL00530.1 hypothetical protein SAMN04487950_1886 [Halogranum rubrum]
MSDDTTASDSSDASDTVRTTPFDERVVEETAENAGVDVDDLTDALSILDASLRGHHSDLESDESSEYVTVDDRRAYAVPQHLWDDVVPTSDVGGDLATAAKEAHTRQAKLLFDSAVESVQFDDETVGVVIGVDTAEEMV